MLLLATCTLPSNTTLFLINSGWPLSGTETLLGGVLWFTYLLFCHLWSVPRNRA